MRFFQIVFLTLFFIASINLAHSIVEMAIKSPVYLCSEVVYTDPLNVRKKCGKA